MRIEIIVAIALLGLTTPTFADDSHHTDSTYYSFNLEAGFGSTENGEGFSDWDMDGWIGTDEDKLHLKAEGERENGTSETIEWWAMYSHQLSTFWDIQAGVRYDTRPDSIGYAVIGFEGLAPYFIETSVHLLVSEDGDIHTRVRAEREFLFTQRAISELYVETDIFAQDVSELGIGAGVASAEVGVQMRYEIARTFAPYLDIKYERAFGETASNIRRHGEDDDVVIGTVGLRFLF